LKEAALIKMPKQMRELFALLLAHTKIKMSLALWELFKLELSKDFLRDRRIYDQEASLNTTDINNDLLEIENFLQQCGSSLYYFLGFQLRSAGNIGLAVASSEVAATLLENG
ncbi:hypothetical protein BB559_007104, partial [Furculomyces boomerangus]